MTLWIPFSGNF